MTRTTDPPPVSQLAAPVELSAVADALADHLGRTARDAAMATAEDAADLLGMSRAALGEAILDGTLDAIVVGGRIHLSPARLQLAALSQQTEHAARMLNWRRQGRRALAGLLAERDLTGDWELSREQRRPLVCRRPGGRSVNYGIGYHSVVLNPSWVGLWASDHRGEFPELAALPTGPVLERALCELPGVSAVSYASPLVEGARPQHRVRGWVRVDPAVWELRVPDDIAEAVGPPRGAEQW
jgi:hypothetical protein